MTTHKQVSNDDIMVALTQFAESVDQRFEGIDQRLFRMENDIKGIKKDIIDLQASHDRLTQTVDRFIARIDTYETEQTARDGQFQQLLAWARKVSEKTGIPLENL